MGRVIAHIAGSRAKGYVLLESIFSMVVIMICFGIAMMVFNMVLSNSGSALKTKARIQLQAEAGKCKSEQLFLDENIDFDAYIIERRIKSWNSSEHLIILELRAITPDGKTLAEHYELVQH